MRWCMENVIYGFLADALARAKDWDVLNPLEPGAVERSDAADGGFTDGGGEGGAITDCAEK